MFMQNINPPQLNKAFQLTLLSLLFISSSLFALTEDSKKPVKIDANSATFNKAKGYAVYEGAVVVVQGTLKINAHKLEIFAPGNIITRIEASGSPVLFEQKMDDGKLAKGNARRIKYLIKEKKLILTGNATLSQDKDTFSSPYIQYSTRTGELKAGNSKNSSSNAKTRVKAIFYPAQ